MLDSYQPVSNITPEKFYNYFKECYKLDYKEFEVDNILSQKYQYKWFVEENEELLFDLLPYIPYDNKKVEELEKEIELYRLEKKLFYGCLFILGTHNKTFISDKRLCAPLLLFPAEIITVNEDKFLQIDIDGFTVNRSVLSMLTFKDPSNEMDSFIEELSNRILEGSSGLIGLKAVFEKYFSNIDATEMPLYPRVWTVKEVRSYLKENELIPDNYKIIPAAGTLLINKSESSLRVLNDLNELAQKAEFNTSIKEFFTEESSKGIFDNSLYKLKLNNDQFKALKNAYTYKNSVIVGPPGTGKSYTITSIISDAVIKNKSVLVVSKTKQAVEVLRSMLEDDFKLKDYLIHTTGRNYRYSLTTKINRCLSGISARGIPGLNEERIKTMFIELKELENEFESIVSKELEISDLEFSERLSFFDKWRKFYLKIGHDNGRKLWPVFHKINSLVSKLEAEIKTYSKRKIHTNIRFNARKYRKDISLFHDALESSSFTSYKKILEKVNHQNVLKVFPVWLANLSELNAVLPLKPELFDLVIIDEATQCDIASALPALFRAKHSVIVGDPNQLRHYSFVSRTQQETLRVKNQLPNDKIFDYRNRSILDVFISKVKYQDQVTFLREHYRSTPSLIEFSNEQFYDGQLEIIKSTPKHTSYKQIELIDVNDGYRNDKGINEAETQAVLSILDELIKKYRSDLKPPSIGIVSPFNSQVNHIKKELNKQYDLGELRRFNLLCGTPYNFQGSEREIILLSFGLCDASHHSAFVHASKPEVLNVAITRAKSYQYVFKSISDKGLKEDSLLRQYFNFINDFTHTNEDESVSDQFQDEVVAALNKNGFTDIKCSYPVAGSLLDILISHNEKNYFIDLIGYPGIFKEAFNLERYKTLGRTGIACIPLHYTFWKKHKQKAIENLSQLIKGI